MKKINYILVILACALLALSATSCKDNKNEEPIQEPIANQYTFDGTTYPILSAGIIELEQGVYGFGFSRYGNEDTDQSQYSSIVFVIGEEKFGELIPNFEGLMFTDTTLGITDPVPTSGTLKVVKNGDNFTVDFDVMANDNGTLFPLKGHYSGALEKAQGGWIF